MKSQPDMFPKPPRKKPRVLMHVEDAGGSCSGGSEDTGLWVLMKCATCGYGEERYDLSVTEAKRGTACPKCNNGPSP